LAAAKCFKDVQKVVEISNFQKRVFSKKTKVNSCSQQLSGVVASQVFFKKRQEIFQILSDFFSDAVVHRIEVSAVNIFDAQLRAVEAVRVGDRLESLNGRFEIKIRTVQF